MWQKMSVLESESAEDIPQRQPLQTALGAGHRDSRSVQTHLIPRQPWKTLRF